MWSSAIASSSPVLTPGGRRPCTAAIAPGGHQPGGPHELDLVRRLDLDHASTPLREQRDTGQDPGRHLLPCLPVAPLRPAPGCPASAAPSAFMARPVTSSISPIASMRDEQALGLVEPGQRRRLFPVDLAGGAGRSRACRRRAGPSRRRRASGGRTAGGPARPRRPRARARGRGRGRGRPATTRSCSACAMVRGKPSSRKPALASGSASRSLTMATVISSGTRSPASM